MESNKLTAREYLDGCDDFDPDLAVDTALSWDGEFPPLGAGDFVVDCLSLVDGLTGTVLVSRRYTAAPHDDEALSIALDAFGERFSCACKALRVTEIVYAFSGKD